MTNFSCLFCLFSDKLVKLACPVCSLVFSSYSTLQEHVELHLQEQLQADGTVSLFSLNTRFCWRSLVLPLNLPSRLFAQPAPAVLSHVQTHPHSRICIFYLPLFFSCHLCVPVVDVALSLVSYPCPRREKPGLPHVLAGLQRQLLSAGTCGAAFRPTSSRELFRYRNTSA